MATFSDMMTLLLCFFVLLFSFSTLDVKKFEALAVSLQNAFSIQPGGGTSSQTPGVQDGSLLEGFGDTRHRTDSTQTEISHKVIALVQEAIKNEELDDEINVVVDERGVVVSLSEQLLFSEGSARIHPEALRILYKIGGVLASLPNEISVEGHTDSARPLNSIYGDNWGLSSARASAVVSYLDETLDIPDDRLRAVGLGSTAPLVPNDSEEHMRLNRRIDIVILSRHSVR